MTQTTFPTKTVPTLAEIEARPHVGFHFGMRPLFLVVLFAAVVGIFILSLTLGSVDIPLHEILKVLRGEEASRLAWEKIILNFRLPKALTAMLAGAALGVSGLQMQTFFRNPLADTSVLGVTAGAGLGVALVILSTTTVQSTIGSTMLASVSTASTFRIAIAASLGAAVVMVIVLMVARVVEGNLTLLILGLMFSFFTSSVVSLLLYFSITEQIQAYVNWGFGSFGGITWTKMKVFAPMIGVGLVLALSLAKSMNALLLGEAYARTMGLSVQRVRLLIIISTSILAGTVTAFCGPIAFLGLAVPHLCRSLLGTSDHRLLLPAAVLMGALLAQISSLIAELPGSNLALPLNAVTALIGAPIVIWVIVTKRNLQRAFMA